MNGKAIVKILDHSESANEEILDHLNNCLSSEHQLPESIRPRIWNFLLLGKSGVPELHIPVRELNTALNSLSNTVKEQIWLDVNRLRPSLWLFQQKQVRVMAYCMLCLFCYQREISYFQGLHEMLAPFIFLFQHEVVTWSDDVSFSIGDSKVPQVAIFSPLWKCYQLFCAFLERFAPFLLEKSEEMLFRLLKRAFCYFQILLVYHSPRLFWTLADAEVTPDMYCISWFVTLFARNVNLEELLVLYDCLLVSGNVMSIFYFALELISRHQTIILQSNKAMLPETLMNISVNGNDQVWETWLGGQRKQCITPQGFHRRFYRALYETKEYSKEDTSLDKNCIQLQVDDWLEEWNRTHQLKDSSSILPFFLWDCRSKEEYDAGHLAIAARIPWESFHIATEGDNKKTRVMVPTQETLNQAVEMFEPLRNIVRICLIGSGDDILDQIDVYPMALALTRSYFAYVSILSGGIHSILEWKQQRNDKALPHHLDWVDLDSMSQRLIEERRKASIQSTIDSSTLLNSQPIVDLRHSFNRLVSKWVRGGKTASTMNFPPSNNVEEKSPQQQSIEESKLGSLADSLLMRENERLVSKHWLDSPLRCDTCDATTWKVWCQRVPKIGSVVDLDREEWIASLQLFYVQTWSESRNEWTNRMIGISEYYFVVLARDTLHTSYASIKTFRPLEDIHQVENKKDNVVVIYVKACVEASDDIPWPWDRQDEKWIIKLDERQVNKFIELLKK
ncbi:TBC1 domain family member 23 [Galdieria sulphuraria]|uniref:TBC1 domain family member 23 n=1 Tax=Galdieria sulphuraria TaxID=130081 RepID=M2XHU7_GALSU|nr:uncharacterized protein Gasu_28910 [Galdieria sulphuraria]EME29667.1 hypothetical protein Gasu_28910 [Galdieria sulphuraria]GJD12181.1 TBC1 domain family member 23 [Galdieria sulphuraria]|eukprot:XP_005706187.1 hypothetical protein Gasu_28910 [Galdieria sulphuraria]